VRHLLTRRGRLLVVSGGFGSMVRMLFNRRIVGGVSMGSTEGLQRLMALVKAGAFFPLIDRGYPFAQVTRAHAHVDTGRKTGAVVLAMVPEQQAAGG